MIDDIAGARRRARRSSSSSAATTPSSAASRRRALVDVQDLIERPPAGSSRWRRCSGSLLLLPLYLSQRRDLKRLGAWMEREPEHPAEDLAASEALLDRAETELEALLGPAVSAEPATEVRHGTGATVSAATRVTSERPALERITMERAALEPHPRWRRFRRASMQPRWLIASRSSRWLLGDRRRSSAPRRCSTRAATRRARAAGASTPATSRSRSSTAPRSRPRAARSATTSRSNGFELGAVDTFARASTRPSSSTTTGQKRGRAEVAKDLGLDRAGAADRPRRRSASGRRAPTWS